MKVFPTTQTNEQLEALIAWTISKLGLLLKTQNWVCHVQICLSLSLSHPPIVTTTTFETHNKIRSTHNPKNHQEKKKKKTHEVEQCHRGSYSTFETHKQSQTIAHNHYQNQINHLYHNKIGSTHNPKNHPKKKKKKRPMKQSNVIMVATVWVCVCEIEREKTTNLVKLWPWVPWMRLKRVKGGNWDRVDQPWIWGRWCWWLVFFFFLFFFFFFFLCGDGCLCVWEFLKV